MAKAQLPGLFEEEIKRGNITKAIKDAHAASAEARSAMVPFDQIHIIDGLNPRVWNTPAVKAHIENIGKSILANGFYDDKPLAVFVRKIDGVDKICLRDGHHRYFGAEYANKKEPGKVKEVPVVFDAQEMSDVDMTVSFATGNMGRPLTPYEMGVVVQRLATESPTNPHPLSKKEIATRLAVTERYIDDLGVLMTASPDVIDLVVTDRVAATLAIQMVKMHGDKAGKHLLKAAEKLAAIGKPAGKITSKHIEPEARPKNKKSATDGAKGKKANKTDQQAEGKTFQRNLYFDGALDSLRALEALRAGLSEQEAVTVDESMKAILSKFGDTKLANYAVREEISDYEETGLVRLGLVEVQADDPPPAKTEEPVKKANGEKRQRSSKKAKQEEPVSDPQPVTSGATAEKTPEELEAAAADL
jgi:hypothetical protein